MGEGGGGFCWGTVSADFLVRNPVEYTGKLGGEACILGWVYLFIISLLFVCLLLITLREQLYGLAPQGLGEGEGVGYFCVLVG